MARRSSQAYVCLRCDDPALQINGAGYDGWIVLLRDHFDTEDQAWPHEKVRLEHAANKAQSDNMSIEQAILENPQWKN